MTCRTITQGNGSWLRSAFSSPTMLFGFAVLVCIETQGEDWPHWRGIGRDDVSAEASGFDGQRWLDDRPAWSAECGIGASSPIVSNGRVYCLGWKDGRDHVLCLAADDGHELWRQSYPCPKYGRHAMGDESFYSGPSSTPSLDEQRQKLYTLSTDGDLRCWDVTSNGEPVWQLNLYDAYKAERRLRVGRSGHRDYGYTSSPLVIGDALIVEVGSPKGTLIAFDRYTGKELWASQAIVPAGHNAGPTPITVGGVACVATMTFEGLLVCRIDPGHEGETVATFPWKTDFANNIASVAVHESDVLITSAYNHYKMVRLHVTLNGATPVWEQKVASKVCTPIVHDGHVYWAWQQLHCLDFKTGEQKWAGGRFGDAGSCILTSDERLIVWSGQGDLTLCETAKRSTDRYTQLAQLTGLSNTEAWPHVVLADGRLYCKDRAGRLRCFEVPEQNASQ